MFAICFDVAGSVRASRGRLIELRGCIPAQAGRIGGEATRMGFSLLCAWLFLATWNRNARRYPGRIVLTLIVYWWSRAAVRCIQPAAWAYEKKMLRLTRFATETVRLPIHVECALRVPTRSRPRFKSGTGLDHDVPP